MRYKSIVTEEGTRIKAKENATSIANPITNNKIIIKPKATSYDKALSLARGLTAPCLAFDKKLVCRIKTSLTAGNSQVDNQQPSPFREGSTTIEKVS